MAHEAYHGHPQYTQPTTHDQSGPRYPPPPLNSSQMAQGGPDVERPRKREPSITQYDTYNADGAQYTRTQQPINDAVNSAFSKNDNTSALSPEILNQITSQITASVMQQLKASNVPPPPPPPVQPPPLQSTNTVMATSPSTTGSPPLGHRNVYTPPLPHRPTEDAVQAPVSPKPAFVASANPTQDQPSLKQDKRPMSPHSLISQADDSDAKEDVGCRPKGPRRLSTGTNVTILEKIWGTLFNEQGQATKRLGQFLRGIAVHLIEDYEPKNSLVITPSKMQQYYEDTKLSNEVYPWQVIFDDRTSSISRLFREIQVQHHLVQDRLDERPDIPGLTPVGFERWVTLMLLAHPDQEFERLQKTALGMPISNPDDRKERFPKEISRRLFPIHPDNEIVTKLQQAMSRHCNVTLPLVRNGGASSDNQHSQRNQRAPEPAPANPQNYPPNPNGKQEHIPTPVASRSSPPQSFSAVERERMPYPNAPPENAVEEDGDDVPTPQPIERERKPYVAHPGGGRTYEDGDKAPVEPAINGPGFRQARSSSIVSHGKRDDKSRPVPITVHQRPPAAYDGVPSSADSRRHRSNSIYNRERDREQHRGRVRSPSASKDFGHRSEGDVPYGSYHSTGPKEVSDDAARRYRDFERERERYGGDRYDPARVAAYDPPDRERESRPRFQSAAGIEGSRLHYMGDEEYFRAPGGGYQTGRDGYQAYPPAGYR